MASRRSAQPSALRAPFLKGIRLLEEQVPAGAGYPFDLPVLAAEPLDLAFTAPVKILVGVNGSGKSTLVEAIAAEAPEHHMGYGGRSLTTRSHGEGYLQVFRNKIAGRGIFVFDEPEAALSPAHQIALLQMIHTAERTGNAQFIIATHSPLLMAYPGATLFHLTGHGIVERPFETTEHFRVLREFYRDPRAFMSAILDE